MGTMYNSVEKPGDDFGDKKSADLPTLSRGAGGVGFPQKKGTGYVSLGG